jgi:hypothetical protein
MLIKTACAACFIAFLIAATVSLAQTEFSADIVDLKKPDAPTLARIYFGKDRKRIEMQSASDEGSIIMQIVPSTKEKMGSELQIGGAGKVIILDVANRTSTVLTPSGKTYSEGHLPTQRPSDLYNLYASVHPANVDDACTEWMQRPGAQGETCRNLGPETVNGRQSVKYELSCYGEICRLWVDRSLHALVKRETKWNTTELRNIQEALLPADLFEIPAGYSKVNQNGIIQRSQPN